jgi:pimeloyl-ACP methyl ester carboxylesterase
LQFSEGKEKLQYWGVSYGTVLGQTFASMFPDRTKRIIVDGVVDVIDYIQGLWIDNLLDFNKTLDWFYTSCANAGPEKCALAETGSTTGDIRERTEAILQHLYWHPVLSSGTLPDVLTWSFATRALAGSLYSPTQWAQVAQILEAVEGADSSPVVEQLGVGDYPQCDDVPDTVVTPDAEAAIACGDVYLRDADFTLKDAQAHYERLRQLSPLFAPYWSLLRYQCGAWKTRAEYSYQGPFAASKDSGIAPILFIGNTADPVTPGRFAHEAAKNYDGARALTVDSPGHTSLALPSTCVIHVVRAYIHTGELPNDGTVCQPDQLPFDQDGPNQPSTDASNDQDDSSRVNAEALFAAEHSIRQYLEEHYLGFGRQKMKT